MKQFQLIALVALIASVSSQSASAALGGEEISTLGRATSADQVVAGSFMCEVTGRIVKRHISSNDARTQQRQAESPSGSTRAAQ